MYRIDMFIGALQNDFVGRVVICNGTIGEDNDQNSGEPYRDNKLHPNKR